MLDYFKEIAEKYSLSLENVLSIALNRYGIIVDNTDENRLRFNLELLDSNKKTYFAVCVNTFAKSPLKFLVLKKILVYQHILEMIKKL